MTRLWLIWIIWFIVHRRRHIVLLPICYEGPKIIQFICKAKHVILEIEEYQKRPQKRRPQNIAIIGLDIFDSLISNNIIFPFLVLIILFKHEQAF